MSSHYDLFIKCDLKEGVPDRVVDGLRYLTDPEFELSQPVETEGIWASYWKDWDRFLISEPKFETFSDFRKEERFRFTIPPNKERIPAYRYSLMYYGHRILDDGWVEEHLPFLYWLAQYVVEDFMGYYKEQLSKHPTLIYAKDFMPK
jgi:hypothetical protein